MEAARLNSGTTQWEGQRVSPDYALPGDFLVVIWEAKRQLWAEIIGSANHGPIISELSV
jgi:hypothetical protein